MQPPPLQPWPRPYCTYSKGYYIIIAVVLAYVAAYLDTIIIFCHYVEMPTILKYSLPVHSEKHFDKYSTSSSLKRLDDTARGL